MIFSAVPLWLGAIAYAYIITAISCSLVIVYDILVRGHRQMMRIMNYVWPITSLYLNVFGLWAYWKMGRPDSMSTSKHSKMAMNSDEPALHVKGDMDMDHPMHHAEKPFWQSVFVSATHCGAGCEIGDFLGEWLVFLLPSGVAVLGSLMLTKYTIDFVFAYLLGIVFQYLPIREMKPELSNVQALKNTIKADSLSLVAFEVGLFGWMAFFTFVLFGSTINPGMPVYWFMMQIGMFLGHFTSYPANWSLVRAGIKEAM
jgi:Domain of unknown function (DUF4396)